MLTPEEDFELRTLQQSIAIFCREELLYLLQVELRCAAERESRLRMFLDFDKKKVSNAE